MKPELFVNEINISKYKILQQQWQNISSTF